MIEVTLMVLWFISGFIGMCGLVHLHQEYLTIGDFIFSAIVSFLGLLAFIPFICLYLGISNKKFFDNR